MENFIKKCEDWINKYEQSQNMVSRRDLQLNYYKLREEYEGLGDMRSFVRNIFVGEVTGRYLVMAKPKEVKRVSFSIRGNRD